MSGFLPVAKKGQVLSGNYFPDFTDLVNVDTITNPNGLFYIRVGLYVYIFGGIIIKASATGQTEAAFLTPFSTNFSSNRLAAGVGSYQGIGDVFFSGVISANASTSKVTYAHRAGDTVNRTHYIQFGYRIVA